MLPASEVVYRQFSGTGISGSAVFLKHIVLWLAMVGGMITSREGRHLSLTVGIQSLPPGIAGVIKKLTVFLSTAVSIALAWSSLALVLVGFDPAGRVGIIPIQLVALILPAGYLVIALRFAFPAPQEPAGGLRVLLPAILGIIAGSFFAYPSLLNVLYSITFNLPFFLDSILNFWYLAAAVYALPMILALIAAAVFGAPIFIVLGGIAYFLFSQAGGALEVVPNEAYTMMTGNTIPAIPLFTFAGFILSESRAGKRLVRLFKALFGWMPGGLVIMAVLVSAFFTTFTGASGVTILALGGLLSFVLIHSGHYSRRFSNGLLTASGSIGLLFPPSLPIILYGVVARVSIKDMFLGGIVPGLVMVLTLSLVGVVVSVKTKVKRTPFHPVRAYKAIRGAFWEILLPIIIILGFFRGFTTLVETGAIAVVYILIVEMFIHRDLNVRGVSNAALKALPIIGGVLVILALARGLSYFIVDAEVPVQLTEWVSAHIQSKYVFLILLNIGLLITGCFMDIFSAIMVVAPLVIPLGDLFGIHPVHLGIIFLVNLELGYITPPVGLDLFLASYRFGQPLATIYRNVVPFFLFLLVAVILITYVPWFSTGLLGLFGG